MIAWLRGIESLGLGISDGDLWFGVSGFYLGVQGFSLFCPHPPCFLDIGLVSSFLPFLFGVAH